MNQEERLDYLVEAFKEDSGEYRTIKTPEDSGQKRVLLRSLMNIRMPREMSDDVLKVQDEYLKERIKENGIVTLGDIPIIRDHLSVWQGDITRLKVDAIVNAPNSQMLGCFIPMHTCIDNCIHTFAGIQLRAECNRQMNLKRIQYGRDYEQPTAEPLLTDGYNLPCRKIIHVVGPIVDHRLNDQHRQQLRNCYINSLNLCKDDGLRSIAFCCISTGVFHFPNKEAAHIAVETVNMWLKKNPDTMDRIIFNVFKNEDRYYYEQELL